MIFVRLALQIPLALSTNNRKIGIKQLLVTLAAFSPKTVSRVGNAGLYFHSTYQSMAYVRLLLLMLSLTALNRNFIIIIPITQGPLSIQIKDALRKTLILFIYVYKRGCAIISITLAFFDCCVCQSINLSSNHLL